ncbi:hypothetical protein [Azomonas macrocytogenes]|uniref:Uncharacterized protein n=1 Tax=Azomonas macrocytogenes TaxID=69962 RepID=A0A839T7J8_AZOMA|nr:hypothetical protein [Azomonas macrocytogenes]
MIAPDRQCIAAAALETLNAHLAFELAVLQIDFLEVAVGLLLFQHQLNQPGLQGAADALDVIRPISFAIAVRFVRTLPTSPARCSRRFRS